MKISHVRFFHAEASQKNFSREIFFCGGLPEKKLGLPEKNLGAGWKRIMIIRMYPIDGLRSNTRTG